MTTASLRFYQNKYRYPHYSQSITPYGSSMDCTPVGMNFKSGKLRVKGNMTDFMSCNYLSFTRDNVTLYAWIEDVQFRTADSFDVSYSVDAWRTYRSKVNLGTQFVTRQPETTNKLDPLLGSATPYTESHVQAHAFPSAGQRVFVVQVRPRTGEIATSSPVQPTPYQIYLVAYSRNNWKGTQALNDLMSVLAENSETENIVTMYSIPYMDLSGLGSASLPIYAGGSLISSVAGFRFLGNESVENRLKIEQPLSFDVNREELLRVNHSVQIIVPEAGILTVPDELLFKTDLRLRQDIDLFSGASNYMLASDTATYYNQSIRGSSVASIPIVSDPLDTYLSQNQNALATSLIGDVASIAGGMALMTPAGRLGQMGAMIGGGTAMSGINNIIGRKAQQADMAGAFSNPPAYLGTALASTFGQLFWTQVTKERVSNASTVNQNYGYPIDMVKPLSFPSSGFIQTEGCSVFSTDGSVPRWALDEINSNFNNGILVHTS